MGVLNTQTVTLKVGGMDQAIDPKQSPPENLLIAENCQITKTGLIEKRLGFYRIPSVDWSNAALAGNIRCMFSTGVELCIVDGDTLYSFNSAYQRWREAGFVSPFTGKEYVSARGRVSYDQCDLAAGNSGHVVYAQLWSSFDAWTTTDSEARQGIDAAILTDDGETQIARYTVLEDSDESKKPLSVRCLGTGDYALVLYSYAHDVLNSSVSIGLQYALWRTDSEFTDGAALYDDVSEDIDGDLRRWYDACDFRNGASWILTRITKTFDIVTTVMDSTPPFAERATVTMAASLAWRRVAVCATGDYIYVVSWEDGGWVYLTVYLPDLTEEVFATKIVTPTLDQVENLGIAAESETQTSNYLSVTWTEVTTPESGEPTCKTRYTRVEHNIGGAWVDDLWSKTWQNVIARSKPLSDASFTYPIFDCALDQNPSLQVSNNITKDVTNVGDENFFVSCGVVLSAVECGDTVSPAATDLRRRELAAVHDVGMAVPGDRNHFSRYLGSANNLVVATDGTVRFATTTLQYSLAGVRDRYGAEEVVLEPFAPVTATEVSVGASVIGGAFVSWYDGSFSCELGFLASPHAYAAGWSTAVSSDLDPGDYLYQAHWQFYDRYGNLHRSSPNIYSSVTVPGPPGSGNVGSLTYLSLTPTHRNPSDMTVEIYRAAATNGTYRRITEPLFNIVNDPLAAYGDTFFDHGQTEADAIFTYTEVPPVVPEGATVVQALGDRLWLAGAFHGEQVLHSKKLYRGTASQAIAAEMNDAFVIQIPNSSRVTALGTLNDNIVVFTEGAIYMIAGDGPDDAGNNNSFSALTPIPCDGGCIEPRSVATYPDGIFYQSSRGIYHISRSNDITFKGAAVQDILADFPVITSAVVVPDKNHVRFTCTDAARTAGTVIIYDYLHGVWLGKWNVRYTDDQDAVQGLIPVAACLHNDEYFVADASGLIMREGPGTTLPTNKYRDDDDNWVPMKVRFGWLQAAEQSGWQRLRRIVPLGELKKACNVKVSVDYDFSDDYTTSKTFNYSTITEFNNLPILSMNYHIQRQKCTAFSVTVEDEAPDDFTAQSGEGITLSGLKFELGVKSGPIKLALVHRS